MQTYGIEIESYGLNENELENAIVRAGGQWLGMFGYHGGRQGTASGGHHDAGRDYSNPVWRAEGDSTINNTSGRGFGHEVVSPILHGVHGLDRMVRVMTEMRRAGAEVNRSCGLHITLGINSCSARMQRMSISSQRRIIGRIAEAYHYFQGAFNQLVPASRRPGAPTYTGWCDNVRLHNGQSYGQGDEAHYYDTVRYGLGRGVVNIGHWASHGIIEFRQHSGSLDGQKVKNWALLLHRLVSWAINDNHENHGCDLRDFYPDLIGLLNMLQPGSELRTALMARAASVGTRGSQPVQGHSLTAHLNHIASNPDPECISCGMPISGAIPGQNLHEECE